MLTSVLDDLAPRRYALCHPHKMHRARGLCATCYTKYKKRTPVEERAPAENIPHAGPPTCHPDRRHKARGYCRSCYRKLFEKKAPYIPIPRKKKPVLVPTCHPERKYGALGLCRTCYQYQRPGYAERKKIREKLRQQRLPLLRPELISRKRLHDKLLKYGLTEAEFLGMKLAQRDCCAICFLPTFPLQIDHDHVTSRVRGLLCVGCNVTVGWVERSLTRGILTKVIRYLQR